MLDVHAPHQNVHTWTDFFIHIGTIVIGLIIAVGLEQSVEYVHHRHQAGELRKDLRRERERNYQAFAQNARLWRTMAAGLENNLSVFKYLAQHPGTPQENLPGELYMTYEAVEFERSVWDAARQSGLVQLIPRDELAQDAAVYEQIRLIDDARIATASAIGQVTLFRFSDPDPSHLSPAQIQEEIALAQAALGQHVLYGVYLSNLTKEVAPDFPQSSLRDDVRQLSRTRAGETGETTSKAHELTLQRLKAAGWDTRWGDEQQKRSAER